MTRAFAAMVGLFCFNHVYFAPGYILSETGCAGPESFVSFSMAYAFAYLMDWIKWLVGWAVTIGPTITRHMVCTMSQHHFFSHAKATRDFGYTPHVSLDDALRITIAYFTQLPASAVTAANASAVVGAQSLSASPLPLLSSPLSTSPVGLRGRSISIAAFPASAVLALAQTAPASAFRLVSTGTGRDGGLAADNENASQSEGRRASVLQPIVDFASSRQGATFVRRAFSHQSLSSLARDDR